MFCLTSTIISVKIGMFFKETTFMTTTFFATHCFNVANVIFQVAHLLLATANFEPWGLF